MLAELVTGRDLPERVQRIGLTIGLACLASFALVITWQDISRIFRAGAPDACLPRLELFTGM